MDETIETIENRLQKLIFELELVTFELEFKKMQLTQIDQQIEELKNV